MPVGRGSWVVRALARGCQALTSRGEGSGTPSSPETKPPNRTRALPQAERTRPARRAWFAVSWLLSRCMSARRCRSSSSKSAASTRGSAYISLAPPRPGIARMDSSRRAWVWAPATESARAGASSVASSFRCVIGRGVGSFAERGRKIWDSGRPSFGSRHGSWPTPGRLVDVNDDTRAGSLLRPSVRRGRWAS